jgi:HAD superfamily hydrolase (TIGR01509 family)
MPIRAITFDFWCTLFEDADGENRQRLRVKAMCEATGRPAAEVARAFDGVGEHFYRHHQTHQVTLRPQDAVIYVAERLGVTLDAGATEHVAEAFATAIISHSPVPVAGALEAVRAAAARCPVGVVSDSGMSPGRSLRVLLDRHGFTPLFQALVFSDEVGVSKPQAPMFETAARQLGVEPSEILHIGDLEHTDIAGIRALGGTAALFTAINALHAADTRADFILPSWEAFVNKLPELLG